MAVTPKTIGPPPSAEAPDAWRMFRSEMEQLFDRFAMGTGTATVRFIEPFPVRPVEGAYQGVASAADEVSLEEATRKFAEVAGELLVVARTAAAASVGRGDEIDAILAEIRSLREDTSSVSA